MQQDVGPACHNQSVGRAYQAQSLRRSDPSKGAFDSGFHQAPAVPEPSPEPVHYLVEITVLVALPSGRY
jgi:hypothetical protein